MGACFSKCKPRKPHFVEDVSHHVQDKLVISQQPPRTPIPQYSNKISPSPPSPVSSNSITASSCSFTCPSNSTISSVSSLSSASSASIATISKDRSFSNEFLWSCFKDNPHIIRINSLKENTAPVVTTNTKAHTTNVDPKVMNPIFAALKETSQKRVIASTPQKRVRSSSPNSQSLTRQKSFRKEYDHRPIYSADYVASRTLRSPSPSRRFGADQRGLALATTLTDSSSRRFVAKGNTVHSVSTSLRKGNLRPHSPKNNSSRLIRSGLSHREICTNQIISKIEENTIKEVPSDHDMDSNLMEDIDNPLISLDCFIFL